MWLGEDRCLFNNGTVLTVVLPLYIVYLFLKDKVFVLNWLKINIFSLKKCGKYSFKKSIFELTFMTFLIPKNVPL